MLHIKCINTLCSATGQLQLKSHVRPSNVKTLDDASVTEMELKIWKVLGSILRGVTYQPYTNYPCNLSVP